MQFVITAYDGEGMLDKRMEVRPLHLEGMERLKKHLIAAGGLLGENMMLAGQTLGLGTCIQTGPIRFLTTDEQPDAKPRDASKVKYIK